MEGWQGVQKCHDEMKLGNNTELCGVMAGWRSLHIKTKFFQKFLNDPEMQWQSGGVAGSAKVS